ncbi:MAG: monooxygenase [Planctomycetes bacterium]|nr:monooxygenase [Planctomycetota bacterium]
MAFFKRTTKELQCLIVGAGAAGIGMGKTLKDLGLKRFEIVDRFGVGASFKRWPKEMRFITPSFPSNSIRIVDLNAVTFDSSPGYTLGTEHPTGARYAEYLEAVVAHHKLPVRDGVSVKAIQPREDGGFDVETDGDTIRTRTVVWAAGEFQYPNLRPFPGAELCLHNSRVRSWKKIEGDDPIIIGGYESGIDAAIHLARQGKSVRVLEKKGCWESQESDPSGTLSPFTWDRLHDAEDRSEELIELCDGVSVTRVERTADGYIIYDTKKREWKTACRPILATGFSGSTRLIADLFEWRDDGFPLVNELDESTIAPGLYLSGPMLRHDDYVFCFIYKYRQRFAVVAQALGQRLEIDTNSLEQYRDYGMFLDDLSCCGDECVC